MGRAVSGPVRVGFGAIWRTLVCVFVAVVLGVSPLALRPLGADARFVMGVVLVALLLGLPVLVLAGMRWWVLPSQGLTWTDIGVRRPNRVPWALLWVCPVAIVASVVALRLWIMVLGGQDAPRGGNALTGALGLSPVVVALMVVGAVVVTPIAEEMLFRGLVAGWLGRWLAPAWNILATALIFALVHGQWGLFASRVVLGVFTGWARHRYDSIWPAVIIHAVNNGMSALGVLLVSR